MTSSAQIKYNNDDDHEGDESFPRVNAEAVRNSLNTVIDGSEANEDNGSTADKDEPTPKRELRERKRVSDPGSSSSKKGREAKGGGKKKGRPSKTIKKEKGEEEDEEEEDDEEDGEVFDVERILAHGWSEEGVLLYKVKWLGFGPEYDTFEPEAMLGTAKQRIEEYIRSLPVETRKELEDGEKKKRKTGRASKGVKRPRAESPSDKSADEKESDDDDDFGSEKKKKSGGRGRPSTSGTKSRGRPLISMGEPDSESDQGSTAKKEMKRRINESPAPKRESGRKKASNDGPSTSNGTRHSTRGGAAAAAGMVEGIFRNKNGEVGVVVMEGRTQKVVSLREALDIAGFELVQFLADRVQL